MKLSKYPSGRYGQIILPRVIRNNLAYLIDFGRTFGLPPISAPALKLEFGAG